MNDFEQSTFYSYANLQEDREFSIPLIKMRRKRELFSIGLAVVDKGEKA